MSGDGYAAYKNSIKNYRNPKYIGITRGELVSVKPVTICVVVENKALYFDDFESLVSFDNVTELDIGSIYTVQFSSDNNTLFVLGDIKRYKKYYAGGE